MSIWRTTICRATVALATLAALTSAIAVAQATDDGLVLVRDGQAVATIVVAEDLSPSERWAVQELQKYIQQISGARLDVVKPDKAPAGGPLIILGQATAVSRHERLDFQALGDDGFYIRTVGNELILAGGRQRGTLYSVYTLLEDLGCRWWTPWDEFVPTRGTIIIPRSDRREVPKLEFRNIMYAEGFNSDNRIWYVRNKLNGVGWEPIAEHLGGEYKTAGGQAHNTIRLVAEVIGRDNITEEMWSYAFVRRSGKNERVQTELCQTNPKVIDATIKRLVQLYKEHPTTKYLVLAHEDNDDYCRCDDCAAIYEREGGSTGQWVHFANIVAEELEKQVPGARIMTDAYGWTRHPPRTLKPRPNHLIRFAPLESDWAHPLVLGSNPQNRQTKEDIEFWGRSASMLSIWTYIGNRCHYMMPNPDLDSIVPNIKFYVDNNAVGIMQQGTQAGTATEFVSLRMWVLAKAMWNPELDSQKLITEFLEGYYGPAAGAVQKYIDIMHRYGRENDYHLGRVGRMNLPFLKPSIIAEAEEALREAHAAIGDDEVLQRRLRHVHLSIWYVLAKRGPMSPTWKATEERVGKLDFAEIARLSVQTGKEWNVQAVADPEEAGPWFQWLQDYGALVKEHGQVLPPEWQGSIPENCRLIQARQIDGVFLARSGQWRKMDDASDHWALAIIKPGWFVQHSFSIHDEVTVGRKYKLFIRLKGAEMKRDGVACTIGLTGGQKMPSIDVKAAELADGKFNVFEIGTFEAKDKLTLYLSLSRDGSMPEVYFDCMWLEEIK